MPTSPVRRSSTEHSVSGSFRARQLRAAPRLGFSMREMDGLKGSEVFFSFLNQLKDYMVKSDGLFKISWIEWFKSEAC